MLGAPNPLGQERTSPLAETLDRVRGLDPEYMRARVGQPSEERCLGGADLVGDGLDELVRHAAGHCDGARDYLGAAIAHMVSDGLLVAALPPLLLEDRLPHIAPEEVLFHPHDTEPWLDRVALTSSKFWALPTDPAAAHRDARVVPDVATLRGLFGDQLVAALTPVFAAIRRRAPFGVIGMWGEAVDGVYSLALWLAQRTGGDQRRAWDDASAIVDLLADRVPQARVRPRPFPVAGPGGERMFSVRGTCCLWYKSQPTEPSAAYCTTCPLQDDADRTRRLVRYLEDQTAP